MYYYLGMGFNSPEDCPDFGSISILYVTKQQFYSPEQKTRIYTLLNKDISKLNNITNAKNGSYAIVTDTNQLYILRNGFWVEASQGGGDEPADLTEIYDARIGYDDTTYPTLGTAIRTQTSELNSSIVNNTTAIEEVNTLLTTTSQNVTNNTNAITSINQSLETITTNLSSTVDKAAENSDAITAINNVLTQQEIDVMNIKVLLMEIVNRLAMIEKTSVAEKSNDYIISWYIQKLSQ